MPLLLSVQHLRSYRSYPTGPADFGCNSINFDLTDRVVKGRSPLMAAIGPAIRRQHSETGETQAEIVEWASLTNVTSWPPAHLCGIGGLNRPLVGW